MKKKSIKFKLIENLTFIKISFNDPDKIMININKTAKLLVEYKISYIELGFSLNRLYLILENKDKNKFIKLFNKFEE